MKQSSYSSCVPITGGGGSLSPNLEEVDRGATPKMEAWGRQGLQKMGGGAEVPAPSSPLGRLLLFREELGIVPSDNMMAPKERLKDTNMEFPEEKGQAY